MPERRAWTYRPKQSRDLAGTDVLLAALTRRGQPPQQPVLFSLTDLMADADLSSAEAIVALSELAQKGLVTIAPVPEPAHIGQAILYAVWWRALPHGFSRTPR